MKSLSLSISGYQIQAPPGVPTGGLGVGSTGERILQVAVQILILGGIILALFFILYAGIQWIMSGGDKEKLQKAKSRLTFAIVGLIVIFLAFFIISIIGGLLGVNLIKQP